MTRGAQHKGGGRWPAILPLALFATLCRTPGLPAQQPLATDNAYPTRYVAAHGTLSLLGGNALAGLEAWAYPLQIFRGLTPSFRLEGAVTATAGRDLLSEIVSAPTSVERIYRGADFTVRERLFVPPGLPGAILTYTVESSHPIEVELSFTPVLDLMWPVGTGGQEIYWADADKAYRLDEPTGRFFAMIGSPDAIAHDDLLNTHAPLSSEHRLRLVLAATGPGHPMRLLMASNAAGWAQTQSVYQSLLTRGDTLEHEAAEAAQAREAHRMRVETPDPLVNQALAWSQTALDQAWVCNPQLGCGLVAGYGPSRGLARRPQYAWFFAGDALTSLPALLLSGEFARAQQVLLFLLKYQDPATGMMWHELSQSAAFVNWNRDYPYMFPHVDVSFLFLIEVADYLRTTGDHAFLTEHWANIEAAYRFCRSVVDPADGLPKVPPGKEGQDEQGHPREELALAVYWVEAAHAYGFLAAQAGHPDPGAEAASLRAQAVIPTHFWNPETHFWNTGLDDQGKGTGNMRLPSPASLRLLDPTRCNQVLDRIAGPSFQTPWGTRGVSAGSRSFDPASYATGSVWAASTAVAAQELWENGRADTAWSVWTRLLPWLTLDSLGHLPEALSGTAFEPQVESVPEQTWSSALLLSSFLEGVVGLKQDAERHTLTLAPHLPATWTTLSLSRIRVGQTSVELSLSRTANSLELAVRIEGGPLDIVFAPALPSGRKITETLVDGQPGCPEPTASHRRCKVPLTVDGVRHSILLQLDGAS